MIRFRFVYAAPGVPCWSGLIWLDGEGAPWVLNDDFPETVSAEGLLGRFTDEREFFRAMNALEGWSLVFTKPVAGLAMLGSD